MGCIYLKIIGDLSWTFYAKKNYEIGDRIKLANLEGTVESIDNIYTTLKTKKRKVIIPIKEVVASQVEIEE